MAEDVELNTEYPEATTPKITDVLIYRTLDKLFLSKNNPKCMIIQPNNMSCGKNAVAEVISTPDNFMIETKNCLICQYHLNLIFSAGENFKIEVKEQNDQPSPGGIAAVVKSKQQPDPTK